MEGTDQHPCHSEVSDRDGGFGQKGWGRGQTSLLVFHHLMSVNASIHFWQNLIEALQRTKCCSLILWCLMAEKRGCKQRAVSDCLKVFFSNDYIDLIETRVFLDPSLKFQLDLRNCRPTSAFQNTLTINQQKRKGCVRHAFSKRNGEPTSSMAKRL